MAVDPAEELIEALCASESLVEFTDAWRALTADEQLDASRHWLRRALALERKGER